MSNQGGSLATPDPDPAAPPPGEPHASLHGFARWHAFAAFWGIGLAAAFTAYWPHRTVTHPVAAWTGVGLALVAGAVAALTPWRRYDPRAFARFSHVAHLALALGVWGIGGARSPLAAGLPAIVAFHFSLYPARTAGWLSGGAWAMVVAAYALSDPVDAWIAPAILLAVFSAVAGGVVAAMKRVAVTERNERKYLATLVRASKITTTLDLAQTLRATVEGVQAALRGHHCVIYLLEPDGVHLVPRSVRIDPEVTDPGEEDAIRDTRVEVGQGLTGWVAQTGEPIVTGDAKRHPRAHVIPGLPVRDLSYLVVPLKVGERTIGVLRLARLGLNQYGPDDLAIASVFANQAAIAIENARLYDEARQLTITDGLTGLYNARYLHERLESELARARRHGHPLTLVMIDSDSLKEINDRFGHLEGDRMLQQLSATIKVHVRSTDLVFRYAGDEFIILLPETQAVDAYPVVERIRDRFATQPLRHGEESAVVTISAGIAGYPDHAVTAEELIRAADDAMYRAKGAGRNRVMLALPPATALRGT